MGIPIIEGREFTADDHNARMGSLIISESIKREFWPDVSAIGKRITTYGSNNQIASMHAGNTGTYNDGPTFRNTAFAVNGAVELNLTPFTGSNNVLQFWDGVTFPGSAGVGADH